jgi:hypothetical protein
MHSTETTPENTTPDQREINAETTRKRRGNDAETTWKRRRIDVPSVVVEVGKNAESRLARVDG